MNLFLSIDLNIVNNFFPSQYFKDLNIVNSFFLSQYFKEAKHVNNFNKTLNDSFFFFWKKKKDQFRHIHPHC